MRTQLLDCDDHVGLRGQMRVTMGVSGDAKSTTFHNPHVQGGVDHIIAANGSYSKYKPNFTKQLLSIEFTMNDYHALIIDIM